MVSNLSLVYTLKTLVFSGETTGRDSSRSFTMLGSGVSSLAGDASSRFRHGHVRARRDLRGVSTGLRTVAGLDCRGHRGVGRAVTRSLGVVHSGDVRRGRHRSGVVRADVRGVRRDGRGGLSRVHVAISRGLASALAAHLSDSFGAISRRLRGLCGSLNRVGRLSGNIADGIAALGHILAGIGTHNA